MAYVGEIARRDLGEEHGQALNEALGQFANYKFQEMMKRNDRNRLKETYGQLGQTILSPEENEAFSNILANTPQEEHSALMQVLPQLFAMKRQQSQQQPSSQPSGFQNFMGQIGQSSGVAQIPQQQQQPIAQPTRAQQPVDSMQLLSRAFESPAIRFQREKMQTETPALIEKKLSREQRGKESEAIRKENAFKATSKFREETQNLEKGAIDSDMRLGKLYNLAKKGELIHPLAYSALKKLGMDVPAFMSADTQQFDELVTNFLRDAKSIFGSRVTNYEMATFIKSIPSLQNTDEGKMKIIKNLKIYNAATKIRAQEMRKIMKENNNIPPLDLREQLEERIGGKLDKLSKLFAEV